MSSRKPFLFVLFAIVILMGLLGGGAITQTHTKADHSNCATVGCTANLSANATTDGNLYLSGKVVLSDGSAPTERVLIQSICHGQTHTETHTDAHGNFSFRFGDRLSGIIESGFNVESQLTNRSPSQTAGGSARDCELSASLAGFSSEKISLDGRTNGSKNVDLGRIVLHRRAKVEGLTISATTAAAPSPARKALAKGLEQKHKGRWDEAKKSLEKAVHLHPKFAVAWFELGTVQMRQNELAAARESFEQSIAADEKYISPYHVLMRLSVGDQNWHRVIELSERLLALDPLNFPDAWYFNGVGHFYKGNFAAAERSARRGLAIGGGQRVPKLEYLLGMALLRTNAYAEAARHMETYLQVVSNPLEVAEAQRQLAEIERLSAKPSQTVASQNP